MASWVETVLDERVRLFERRYGRPPTKLPISLDEWVELGVTLSYIAAVVQGSSHLIVPVAYHGFRLELVWKIKHRADGSILLTR